MFNGKGAHLVVTGDESKLRALQAEWILYLKKVISEIDNCTRKRDVNKILAVYHETESQRRSEIMKVGQAIRKAGGKKKYSTGIKGSVIDVRV